MVLTSKENRIYLDKKIDQIQLNGKTAIVFDFDELLVPTHLTKIVTRKLSKPMDKSKIKNMNLCSFEGILYLNNLMENQDISKYENTRDNIAKTIEWRDEFDKLIKELVKEFTVIVISSGLKDICYSKLKEINFNEKNIFGGEFLFLDNQIRGSKLIISYLDKGYIVQRLRENCNTIISVGHSLGDKEMLNNSDISIAYKSDTAKIANHYLDNIAELRSLINSSCNKC